MARVVVLLNPSPATTMGTRHEHRRAGTWDSIDIQKLVTDAAM
jgi:hypothetical protein